MPNTSTSTLHMGENETMSASVNKNTIEDSGWYIVNLQWIHAVYIIVNQKAIL